MVKALLKIDDFAKVMEQASKIAAAISKSSAKWAKRFYDIVCDLYKKDVSLRLLNIGATRWNSAQAMFASQLRVRTACRMFCVRYSSDSEFPK